MDDFSCCLEMEFELICGKDVNTLLHQVVRLVQREGLQRLCCNQGICEGAGQGITEDVWILDGVEGGQGLQEVLLPPMLEKRF